MDTDIGPFGSMWRGVATMRQAESTLATNVPGTTEVDGAEAIENGPFEVFLNELIDEGNQAVSTSISVLNDEQDDGYRYAQDTRKFESRRRQESTVASLDSIGSGFSWMPEQRGGNVSGLWTLPQASVESDPRWLKDAWERDRVSLGDSSCAESSFRD